MDAGDDYDVLKVTDAPYATEINLFMNYSAIPYLNEMD